ncbi:MAG: hypothetical protein ACTSWY_05640 [Promethearchaeota archaeon]
MCEFKVKKLKGRKFQQIGEDVIFFKHDLESGTSRFADILGRSVAKTSDKMSAFVTEINMLEDGHDITVIESDVVPLFSRFIYALNLSENEGNNSDLMKKLVETGNTLINAIKQKISK